MIKTMVAIAFLFILGGSALAMTAEDVEKVHDLIGSQKMVDKEIDILKAMSKSLGADKGLVMEISDCKDAGLRFYGYEAPSPDGCREVLSLIDEDDIKNITDMMEKRKSRIEKKIKSYGVNP